jgi:rhamnose transport system ATP-binding protein
VPVASAVLLELIDISRSFPGVIALDRVSLSVAAGEVHALVGENGAGKSTLINILSGLLAPDSGRMLLDGVDVAWANPVQARRRGIVAVHQEAELFPTLSVAENMALEQGLPVGPAGWVRWKKIFDDADRAVALMGEPLDVQGSAASLSVAQRHMTQIAAAVTQRARLLVLDEPTSALTARETEWLFERIAKLKAAGVGIVYISHRQEDIFQLADRITVLRDGRRVWSGPRESIDRTGLIRHMVGREYTAAGGRRVPARKFDLACPPRFEVKNFSGADHRFIDISLQAHAGEVLGIYGLVGSGRSEFARAVFGLQARQSGTVEIDGRPQTICSPAEAVAAGIAYLPEDRLREGVFRGLSVRANSVITALAALCRGPLTSAGRERAATATLVNALGIKCHSAEQPVGELSGGNQQKVVLARWLLGQPKVLILDEPTRGVDVGAKAEIHRILGRLAEQGVAIVMISSDLTEVLEHSDRVLVFRSGRAAAEFVADRTTADEVTAAALPLTTPEPGSRLQAFSGRAAGRMRGEMVLAAAIALIFIALTASTNSFATSANLWSLLASAAVLTILSLGAAFIILAGAIDISLGSQLALAAAVAGLVLKLPYPTGVIIPAAIAACLATGATLGVTNALLTIAGRVHPIVITLGTMTIYRGLLISLTGGDTITDLPRAFTRWSTSEWLGVNGSAALGFLTAIVAYFVLVHFRCGRHLVALGSSPAAARLAGISRSRSWMLAFGAGGLLAALAGLLELAQTGALQSGMGSGYELQAIAAAVIGGVSISGGRGSVPGVCLGALLLSLIYNAVVLWQISGHHYALITGVLLLVAVLADRVWRRAER